MKHPILRIGLAILIAACLIGCGTASVVTLDEYNRVEIGMSYSEVVTIIGEKGEQSGSGMSYPNGSDSEGTPNLIYTWKNKDFSNMICIIENDKVIAKDQSGLGS